jgi:anti-sigma factor RsiW
VGTRVERTTMGFEAVGGSVPLPDDLSCRELVELVTDYLEQALPPGERLRFERHLATCAGCDAYLRQLDATLRAAGRLTEASLPADARGALLRAFRGWRRRAPLA